MRDQRIGFFTLSKLKNWLTKLLINLNPPLKVMAYAPVMVKKKDQLKRNL